MKSLDITKNMLSGLSAFFLFLGYFAELRPYVEKNYGIYYLGFMDGAIALVICLIIIFFIASLFEKKDEFTEKESVTTPEKSERNDDTQKSERNDNAQKPSETRFDHVEARLFYPSHVSYELGERTPARNNPRHKLILVTDLKKAYWVGEYAWNLIKENKVNWFSEDEMDLEEWCKKEGYKYIQKAATEENLLEPFFEAEIIQKKEVYEPKDVVLFKTHYRGELINGFFDNEIILSNKTSIWCWAPETLANGLMESKGKLNGYINKTCNWSWTVPINCPKGNSVIFMRVYNHFGASNRPIIAQKKETIKISY